MDSPAAGKSQARIAARTSLIDSTRGCGLTGVRIDKEGLKTRLQLPFYLRQAMLDSVRAKDPAAGIIERDASCEKLPDAPIVIFVNSKSGGRYGPVLKKRLQELMGPEHVFDLSEVKPHEFVRYGLGCLEKLAEQSGALSAFLRLPEVMEQ